MIMKGGATLLLQMSIICKFPLFLGCNYLKMGSSGVRCIVADAYVNV